MGSTDYWVDLDPDYQGEGTEEETDDKLVWLASLLDFPELAEVGLDSHPALVRLPFVISFPSRARRTPLRP